MAKKTTVKRVPRKPESEVAEAPATDEQELSPEAQAAVQQENAAYNHYIQQAQTQYLQTRIAELTIENQSLRSQFQKAQERLQEFEDSKE